MSIWVMNILSVNAIIVELEAVRDLENGVVVPIYKGSGNKGSVAPG